MTIVIIVFILQHLLKIEHVYDWGVSSMAKKTKQSKKIIICCDGTGNKPSNGEASNVYDLVELLKDKENQIVFYDTGLGTEYAPGKQTGMAKFINRTYGLAFAVGLQQNIKDAYGFLVDHYEPGDKIYIFGFSRGAYTARAVIGMVHQMGLLKKTGKNLIHYAASAYMKQGKIPWADLKSFQSRLCQYDENSKRKFEIPIEYVGLWDTVKSVGIRHNGTKLAYTRKLPSVKSVRHAVALDEKRTKFRPNHITALGWLEGSAQTMWFQGVHSDIGGGYPEDERGLSDHAMRWILEEAISCGLDAEIQDLDEMILQRKSDAVSDREYYKQHNSLTLGWKILGWWKRKLPERAWFHETAVKRLNFTKAKLFFDRTKHIEKLENDTAKVLDDLFIMKQNNHLLVQKLTKNELQYLDDISNNAEMAKLQLIRAGVKSWRSEFESLRQKGNIEISDAALKKANRLFDSALLAVDQKNLKAENGVLDSMKRFINMRSIKTDAFEKMARDTIISTAPYLLEALAEA